MEGIKYQEGEALPALTDYLGGITFAIGAGYSRLRGKVGLYWERTKIGTIGRSGRG